MTRPARENSHGPSTPKINKQETSIINDSTHRLLNNEEQRQEKESSPQGKIIFKVIAENNRKSRGLILPDEYKTEPNTYKIKEIYLDMIRQTAKNWRKLDDLPFRKHSADWPI
jgi:hypothetical protein